MIQLIFNSDGIFTFNVDDWATLRKEHRIVGEIIGNTSASIPYLPVKILPEETLLLIGKDIVCLKQVVSYNNDAELAKQKYDEFENICLETQKVEYKKTRRAQLEKVIDKIVEKQRKSNDMRSAEEILNEEVEKSTSAINKDNMIWPIFLQPIDPALVSTKNVGKEEVWGLTTKLKSAVYRDLWEKGYYVTQGGKFGGDYLAYLGDPIYYHAIFIVRCVQPENMSPSEIVAFGRLGTSIRKRAVLTYKTYFMK